MGAKHLPWAAAICLLAAVSGVWAGWAMPGRPPPQPRCRAAKDQPPLRPAAAQEAIPTRDLSRIVQDAGPLMIPILGCSLLLVTFALERAISLRRGRVIPKPFVTRFLQQLADGELDRRQAAGPLPGQRQPGGRRVRRGGPEMGPAGRRGRTGRHR